MSERKVLNKYYPPDYDPSKIPKLKRAKDRQYVIRVMAPFNLRCKTCGNYIYKGTKFNARMETVQEENYIGLRIYRFYIKCTKCVAEITFKTDPENMDYAIEHGATRNFEAEKILDQQEKQLQAQKEADESNPMKMLEIRTRDSKREMELLEKLEELKDLNERHLGVDYDEMLRRRQETEEERITREKAEEDAEIRKIFDNGLIRRLQDEDSDEDSPATSSSSASSASKRSLPPPSEILTINETSSSAAPPASKTQKLESKKRAIASLGIVRKQKKAEPKNDAESEVSNTVTAKPEVHQTTTPSNAKEPAKPSGLGLLGNYGSDSSGSSNDSDS